MIKLSFPVTLKLFFLLVSTFLAISCKVQQMNSEEMLQHGNLINEKVDTHLLPDVMPEFKGGTRGLNRYLNENVYYPKEASEKKISGKVLVNFVIKRDGSIVNIKVIRGVHELLDEEAIRVVSIMPRWIPGYLNGKPVNTNYTLPISFMLQ